MTFDGEVLDLDFGGVDTPGPIPPGIYPCRVDECHAAASQASGEPTLYFSLVLTGPANLVGRKARYSKSLQPQARPYLKQDLEALGYTKAQLKGHLRLRPTELVDMTCACRVVAATRDGEPTYNVTRLYPITKATSAQVVPESAPFSDLIDEAFEEEPLEPTIDVEVAQATEPKDAVEDDLPELDDLDELTEDDFLGL